MAELVPAILWHSACVDMKNPNAGSWGAIALGVIKALFSDLPCHRDICGYRTAVL